MSENSQDMERNPLPGDPRPLEEKDDSEASTVDSGGGPNDQDLPGESGAGNNVADDVSSSEGTAGS